MTLVVLGVWIHINRDTLFYTHLLRFNHTTQLVMTSSQPAVAASQSTSGSLLSYDVISVDNSPFLLIIAGCCITTVGFLGCCGAYAESVCFLGFVSNPLRW